MVWWVARKGEQVNKIQRDVNSVHKINVQSSCNNNVNPSNLSGEIFLILQKYISRKNDDGIVEVHSIEQSS